MSLGLFSISKLVLVANLAMLWQCDRACWLTLFKVLDISMPALASVSFS